MCVELSVTAPQASVGAGAVQFATAEPFVVLTVTFAGQVKLGAVTSPAQGLAAATNTLN